MKIGTKSVLFGAHCFFLHPWFVAAAWWRLYGFPLGPAPLGRILRSRHRLSRQAEHGRARGRAAR
jgi:hypothetical protein